MPTPKTNPRTYWAPHVTVAAVIEHDARFLMVEERILGDIVMTQPAGHLDEGETLADAVRREVREETGLRFEPEHLCGIYQWTNPANASAWLRFTFTGRISGETAPAPQDDDILRAGWFSEEEIRSGKHRLRSPQVLTGLDDYNSGRRFPLDIIRELIET